MASGAENKGNGEKGGVQADLFAPRPINAASATLARTGRVKRLRIILPIIAILLLVIMLGWPYWQDVRDEIAPLLNAEQAPPPATVDQPESEVANPRFVGTDRKNRPFTITADKAIQSTDGGAVDLVNAEADMTLDEGHWIALRAENGRYDRNSQTLDLSGHVVLFHDSGYQLDTDLVHVNLDTLVADSSAPTSGSGPMGEFHSQGFTVGDSGNIVTLKGQSHILLRGTSP
ncbi:LPS export ABC transporter periplasmic protein LptC [Radicibacter daui]|uniref:LPS export ABC transporter periplasmic protein LptC n=1 Tax=Radicibacter daui TaxID=3064829 RepID=UPI004046B069